MAGFSVFSMHKQFYVQNYSLVHRAHKGNLLSAFQSTAWASSPCADSCKTDIVPRSEYWEPAPARAGISRRKRPIEMGAVHYERYTDLLLARAPLKATYLFRTGNAFVKSQACRQNDVVPGEKTPNLQNTNKARRNGGHRAELDDTSGTSRGRQRKI